MLNPDEIPQSLAIVMSFVCIDSVKISYNVQFYELQNIIPLYHCAIVIYFSLEITNTKNKKELEGLKVIMKEKEEEVKR